MKGAGPRMGTLYLVSTPLGNPEDITLRALRVLREVGLVAAEDTRQAQRLLARHQIDVPCISYHEHNRLSKVDDLLTALANGDVALVSNAGTPGMADPGFELVSACIAAGFAVVSLPGPSAPIAALVASGLPTDQFTCLGFLPRRGAERRALLHTLADAPQTLVCFEAPHRLADALVDLLAIMGDRRMAVARDLTKAHEEFRRERISQALAHYREHRPRGDFTLVVEGRRWPVIVSGTITDASGRTLSGQVAEAFWHSIRHARPIAVGFNCALGAAQMRPHIAELARVADTFISCYPNAGLPNAFGEYDETAAETSSAVAEFASSGLVNLVGGCCGTTPEHIRQIIDFDVIASRPQRIVVGVDTGLSHIAAALGRLTLCLFSGSRPELTGVYAGDKAINLGGDGAPPSAGQVIEAATGLL